MTECQETCTSDGFAFGGKVWKGHRRVQVSQNEAWGFQHKWAGGGGRLASWHWQRDCRHYGIYAYFPILSEAQPSLKIDG